jgi:hypothetical protein
MSERLRTDALFALLALVLSALAFGSQLGGDFVWDDAHLVRDNASLRSLGGLYDNFRYDTFRASGQAPGQFYRPVQMASFWLQYQLGARDVAAYRVLNIALSIACAYLLFRLLLRLSLRAPIALPCALLLAVHPVITEPVAVLVGRQETLGLGFMLAALLLWPKPDNAQPMRGIVLASLALGLGFLAKESYAVGVFLIALLEIGVQEQRSTRALARLALPVLGVGLLIGLRAWLGVHSGSSESARSLLELTHTLISLIAYYGGLIITLSDGETFSPYEAIGTPGFVIGLVLLLAFTLGALLAWWRAREQRAVWAAVCFGNAWFLLGIAPLILVVPVLGMHQNRYAYCALAGFIIALAGSFELLARTLEKRAQESKLAARAALASAGLVLLMCAAGTRLESTEFADNLTLYSSNVARNPHNGYALYHLATAVGERDGCTRALPLYRSATQYAVNYSRAWNNLTGCLIELGRYREALEPARRALELSPSASSHYHLGAALLGSGQRAAGLDELTRALAINPQHRGSRLLLAQIQGQ